MNLLRSIWKRLHFPSGDRIGRLNQFKRECESRDKNSPLIRLVDDELRFLRWNRFVGNDILRPLKIQPLRHEDFPFGIPGLVSMAEGKRIEKTIDDGKGLLVVEGVSLPIPARKDEMVFAWELNDVVLPSLLRRKIHDFDAKYERIHSLFCQLGHNGLYGAVEGPYEFGKKVQLEQGDVVLDCGANMGLFSAVASSLGCSVYAFEPLGNVIERYLSVTASIHPSISVRNYAIWDAEGKLEIEVDDDNIGASTCVQACRQGNRPRVSVDMITLDRFVEESRIERVDFIKADIEGAERHMLLGARNILKKFAPKLSICTYHLPDDPQVLREIILDANPGYTIINKYKKMYAYIP